MEAKLQEYRALRRRKELIDNAKRKIDESKDKLIQFLTPKIFSEMNNQQKEDEILLLENEEQTKPLIEEHHELTSEVSEVESFEEEKQETWRQCASTWSMYGISWLTLYIIFLKLQFGAVFFVISLLVFIYFNTRTLPRKQGEVSAYSVFNENCVSIDGTLKAEQLERELMFGPGSVR